jgi:hypothetical protein
MVQAVPRLFPVADSAIPGYFFLSCSGLKGQGERSSDAVIRPENYRAIWGDDPARLDEKFKKLPGDG